LSWKDKYVTIVIEPCLFKIFTGMEYKIQGCAEIVELSEFFSTNLEEKYHYFCV
jgi:hypothetical protein